MPATQNSSINLLLPILPETQDQELFKELARIYNAINLLANGVDKYTNSGTVLESITDSEVRSTQLTAQLVKTSKEIKKIKTELAGIIDISASYFELRKAYYKYKLKQLEVLNDTKLDGKLHTVGDVTFDAKLNVTGAVVASSTMAVTSDLTSGKAGFNGVAASGKLGTATGGTAPAGGVGTAAGGWDTAGNRDAAIAAIAANKSAIDAINTLLTTFGLRT